MLICSSRTIRRIVWTTRSLDSVAARRNDVPKIAERYRNVVILGAARSQDWTALQPKLPMTLLQDLGLLAEAEVELTGLSEQQCADLIRIFTGYHTDALSYDRQWNLCVEAVQGACDVAARYGVRIGVQNHHDIGVGVESYENFLDDVDRPNC